MDIKEIKAALDNYFGISSEMDEAKEQYGERASLTYCSPTGRVLCVLQLVRNGSNKNEWYFSGNYVPHTDLVSFLRGLPEYKGYTHKDENGQWVTNDGSK